MILFNKPIFKNKNFMLLWIGQLVSQIGNCVLEFALSWYIYDITGSTLALSISVISFFLPNAILSPFSGVIADKYDRRKIIILCDIISGSITLVLFSVASYGSLTLTAIVIFNILASLVSAMFSPAISAATQSVLSKDEYQDAGALTQMQYRFASIVGAALGGWLLKSIGIQYLLLLDGLSFLISAASEYFINIKKVSVSQEKQSFKESIGEALNFLLKNKILLFLTLFAGIMANGMFMSVSLYMPGIFKDTLGKTSAELGIYFSIEGVAATATSLYFLFTKKKLNPYRWTLITLALEGIVLLGIGLMNNLAVAYAISALGGFSFATCSIACITLRRLLTPNEIMGRVGSFGMIIGSTSMPVFTVIFGVLGESFNLQKIIFVGSIIFLITLIPAPFIFAKEKKDLNLHSEVESMN